MTGRAAEFRHLASWRAVIGVMAGLWFGFQIVFGFAYVFWTDRPAIASNPEIVDAFVNGSTPAAVRWSLATFGIYLGLLWAGMKVVHNLRMGILIGQRMVAWRQFWRVCLYLSPLYAFLVLPAALSDHAYQAMALSNWILLLPSVLALLFVQISAEEFVFRGYLQSHLAALSRHPIIWMGLPSILFGIAHYDPTQPAYSAWAYVAWATALGLVCADLTARAGTLGPALAVHFINNTGAVVILAADTWLYGAALFVWPTNGIPWQPWIPYEALMLTCVWLTARVAIRR